ncbi:MAG: hypothetical protein PHP30_04010 [Bacteroidales bacterium]|nr:hypothetical protein [Bacteroidales bacterium]MDD3989245.1 hypothetical protein [Bacteroidales bacterium]
MNLKDIEIVAGQGDLTGALSQLKVFLESNPSDAAGWYLMGNFLRRMQRWGEAINAYNRADELDPGRGAKKAVESIYEILRFQNTDLMNP